ncbi:MAG: Mu transposase C-terminal domain-containing protein [Kangiella sp.]|nr:Mu transposase C-terminal domain-containing protein [Kangiella sp.]MCW9029225.1 Mu transposase C-terminal domain-containing protein [Kangiella sp.]
MNRWLTVKQIAGLPGVPGTERAVRIKAKKEGWAKKRAKKGKGMLYDLNSLPAITQAHLLKNESPASKDECLVYSRELLWRDYESATDSQKKAAKNKVEAISEAMELMQRGMAKGEAFKSAAKTHGITYQTLYNYHNKVKHYDKSDWLAALVRRKAGGAAKANMPEQAWEIYKADYLRPEQPSASACYHRLRLIADEKGWKLPSLRTFERRIESEVSRRVRILAREGKEALMALMPAQRRTVKDLHALEWVNGDGYQHNVFVSWTDEKVERPKTWVWQDVYSRKILAYRVDVTENTDVLRLSFGDLIEQYGIPQTVTIDNTRSAANKVMTGGMKNRYRFKVNEDEADGIFKLLGINVKWTSVNDGKGHGQAKPVERAFGIGGLGEIVDKHPSLAGAYTGSNPMAKPENYASKAIPINDFLRVLERGIREYNQREGRQTEICRGVLSFDQAFYESYEKSVIQKATPEQRRLWLLSPETVTVRRDSTVTLKAGSAAGYGRNRYEHPELSEYVGKQVVVRYDNHGLHADVYVYTKDGRFICQAQCIEDTGFGDSHTARTYNRKRKQSIKAAQEAMRAEVDMSILESPEYRTDVQPGALIDSKVVRPHKVKLEPPKAESSLPITESIKETVIESFEEKKFSNEPSMTGMERYKHWLLLEQAIEHGYQPNPRQQRFYEGFPTTTEFKTNKEVFEDFEMDAPVFTDDQELIYGD